MNIVSQTNDGPVMTRTQAAEYLHLCKASLDKLPIPKIHAGKRRILYRRETIEAWLLKLEGVNYGNRA